ncbi:MAG TPA: hypothetical protein VN622_05385 [Clostridia bacterium]|nr:hypothetical protein [Clostridia bacterium]
MQTVLSSWKEIASYLGKGVRTVQRWERELGLPVRRPENGDRRIVFAMPAEVDKWLQKQSTRRNSESQFANEFQRMRKLVHAMVENTQRVHAVAERLTRHYNDAQELRTRRQRRLV